MIPLQNTGNRNPSVIILAAGNSGRMGRLKAFLPFDEHQCFLEKIIAEFLEFGVQKIVVVLNKEGMNAFEELNFSQKDRVQTVLNPFPERERFYSLQTGLKVLNPNEAVFIHNADNPFVQKTVLEILTRLFRQNTYVVPTFKEKGGHPVLLSPEIAQDLVSAIDYSQNLKVFLQKYKQVRIAVSDEKILANINSQTDYEQYFGRKFE